MVVASLRWATIPQFWIAGTAAALFRGVGHQWARRRKACDIASVVCLGWAIAEGSAGAFVNPPMWATPASTDALSEGDPDLEFRLRAGSHLEVPSTSGGITYTIDSDGLRRAPGIAIAGGKCVLFFGCSFTFGEGLSDDQTLPAQVARRAHVEVRNFAVPSSSPSYALGQIQTGFVDRAARCDPSHAIYMVIPHHLIRIVGSWIGKSGPRYVLKDDRLVREGTLGDRSLIEWATTIAKLSSAVYPLAFDINREIGTDYVATEDDLALYRAIILQIQRELKDRWPGIQFDLLVFDSPFPGRLFEKLGSPHEVLDVPGIRTHFLGDSIPAIAAGAPEIWLPTDEHPNAAINGRIADLISRDILGK